MKYVPSFEALEDRFVLSSDLNLLPMTTESALVASPSATVVSMGTYQQVAGAIPSPTSASWFTWYNTLETARLNYSLQARSQTFYFSSSGNDANGDGSAGNPWQSLAKARTVLTQTGGDVAILFKRGDEFIDTMGLNVTQPRVTIGAWGDSNLPKPMISAFSIKLNSTSGIWSQGASSNLWTTSAPNRIGWIREATNDVTRLSPFTYLQSSAAVSSTLRSWTWQNGTLYLNPGNGIDPNSINWEAVGDVNQCGIILGGDGGLVTDIRTDGWGCVATQKYESWGIVLDPINSDSVVAMNCESFYNGIHGIGTMAPSTVPAARGGFSLLLNNVSGYTNATAGGTTVYIFFSPKGSNEVISQGNTVRFGQLPDFNLVGGGLDTSSQAFYGHTSGSLQYVSLVISINDKVIKESFSGSTYSSGGNNFDQTALPGTNSTLSTLKRFVVNYQILTGSPYTISATSNTVQMNCMYQMSGNTGVANLLTNNGGWFINCIWDIQDPVAMERYFLNAYSANPVVYFLDNSFLLSGAATAPYQSWDLAVISGASSANNVFAGNCLFVGYGDRTINLNLKNDGLHLVANAYYGVNNPSSYNGDPFGLSLLTAPSYPLSLTVDSPIVGGARYSTFGYTVDYDFFGHTRNLSAPTQGAVEFDWSTLPVTDGGSYYLLAAGQSLALESRNIRSDATYSWDLNEDGVYGDAIGATPTLTWNQLRSLGIGNGTYHIRLQTTVGSTVAISDPAILKVLDQTPYSNAGSSITINQGTTLSLNASKSMSFTSGESLTYSWDVNGDGIFGDAVGLSPQLTYTQLASLGLRGGQTYSIRVQVAQSFELSNFSISAPITLTYKSVPIVAKSGGPYSIVEGQSLTLNASGSTDSLGQSLSYSWDVNGDGTFGDAFGVNPTLTWVQLNALGIIDGSATRNVRVQVSDSWGRSTTSATSLLTVNNAAPTAAITGIGALVRNETVTYTLTATDSSSVDQAAGFTFKIDWNNDGIDDQTVIGASGTTVTHVWSSLGSSTIRLTATDKDGGVSSGSTLVQSIVEYTTRVNGGVTDLIWGGSAGIDNYTFSQEFTNVYHIFQFNPILGDPLALSIDVVTLSNITGMLRAYGGDGDDTLVLYAINNAIVKGGEGDDAFASIGQSGPGTTVFDGGNGNDQFWSVFGDNTSENFIGGAGNDFAIVLSGSNVNFSFDLGDGDDTAALVTDDPTVRVTMLGGAGDDLLLGGKGKDTIDGGTGNDFIVGDFDINNVGGGADSLIGGDGNDIIIGQSGPDTIVGGNGQDLIIGGNIVIITYFPQGDENPPYQGYQQIWDVWRNGDTLANREAELQGDIPGYVEPQYYMQTGDNMLDDGAVDSALGGADGDWLVYNFSQDSSDYLLGVDDRTNS